MSNVIEGKDRFAPKRQDEFVSGDVVEPGVYVDVNSGALLTLHQADELPSETRIVRFARRFRRVQTGEKFADLPACIPTHKVA